MLLQIHGFFMAMKEEKKVQKVTVVPWDGPVALVKVVALGGSEQEVLYASCANETQHAFGRLARTQVLHGSFFHTNITVAHLSVLLSAYQTNPFAVCRKR